MKTVLAFALAIVALYSFSAFAGKTSNEKESEEVPTFEGEIPDEVLAEILSWLRMRDLSKASQVNHQFERCAKYAWVRKQVLDNHSIHLSQKGAQGVFRLLSTGRVKGKSLDGFFRLAALELKKSQNLFKKCGRKFIRKNKRDKNFRTDPCLIFENYHMFKQWLATIVDKQLPIDQALQKKHISLAEFYFLLADNPVAKSSGHGMRICQRLLSKKRFGEAESLIQSGFDVNTQNDLGATPLRLAACQGSLEAMQFLLETGADPNIATYEGQTPLTKLTRVEVWKDEDQAVEAAKELLNHEADVNHQTVTGTTALHFAIDGNRLKLARCLLESGARPNIQDKRGATPLRLAACQGSLEAMQFLLEAGADPNIAMYEGQTPLTKVTDIDVWDDEDLAIEAATDLLKHGADLNHQTNEGDTALHVAIEANRLKLAQFILERGARVNLQNCMGETPLNVAVAEGHLEAIQLLLKWGADPRITNYERVPLAGFLAFYDVWKDEDRAIEAAIEILGHGGKLNAQTKSGHTPLHLAIKENRLKLARFFLENGAHPNVRNKKKETPLDIAMRKGSTHAVDLLLSYRVLQ
jgi:ankyrin repeat protein